MILVDANLLVYAHVASFQQHERTRAWLDEQLNGNFPVGLPWNSMLAFLRIVTNPRIFQKPEAMSKLGNRSKNGLIASLPGFPSLLNGTVNC